MGIDKDVAKFLLSARERGVNFKNSLTLGNQKFQIFKHDFAHLTDVFKLDDFARVKTATDFLRFLGAEEISAMDFSDYEGAAIIHDLNQPISDELKGKYTFVLDGGTIEHVFNFPVALANAMEMVTVGGHLMIITGGNNFFGHGFYQFSPELFYRALSAENGFEVTRLVAAEVRGRWFEAADPKTIESRVELVNDKPTYLMILARKLEDKPLFASAPQQSDYVAMWQHEAPEDAKTDAPEKLKNLLKKNDFIRETLIGVKQKQFEQSVRRERSFANERAYKLVDK